MKTSSVRTIQNQEIVQQQLNNNTLLSTRQISFRTNISRRTVQRILHDLKAKPYVPRLIHQLSDDDFDRRLETCEKLLNLMNNDPNMVNQILWSDESNFCLSGTVNRHDPHFTVEKNIQHRASLTVWAGISSTGIIGPVFIEGTLNADKYLELLQQHVFTLDPNTWFMQDGAPAHYARVVREALVLNLQGRWIGRRGSVEWAPRSCDLTPCDFFCGDI